jgi:RND family efflux transporter MFP subunit
VHRGPYLILITALAAACSTAPAEQPSAGPAIGVTVIAVAQGDWQSTVEAGGVVVSRETATISSRVVAPIARVLVRAGDRVKRGQTLVVLDAASLGAEAARAAGASLAADHASRAAASDLQAADAAVALATTTHTRIAALHSTRSATTQELDQAQAALTTAESRRAAAAARIAEAQAGTDAARAAGRVAAILAGYATLSAPFDGIVTNRLADPGSLAAPGAPLIVVEDTSSFRLEIRIDAARAPLVRLNQTLAVRLDGAADAPWLDGRVIEISRIDPNAHSFAVKVALPATAGVRSGLFGRAKLAGATRRVLSVPAAAVLERGQLSYVFVATHGVARLRAISPGGSSEGRTEILDGLIAGESVIVSPPESLRDGAAIAPIGSGGAR